MGVCGNLNCRWNNHFPICIFLFPVYDFITVLPDQSALGSCWGDQAFPYADNPPTFLQNVEKEWLKANHVLSKPAPDIDPVLAKAMLYIRTAAVVLTLDVIIQEHLELYQRYDQVVGKCKFWWVKKHQGMNTDRAAAAVIASWIPFVSQKEDESVDTIWARAEMGKRMSKAHVDEANAEKTLVKPAEGTALFRFISTIIRFGLMKAEHLFSTEEVTEENTLPSHGPRYTVHVEWDAIQFHKGNRGASWNRCLASCTCSACQMASVFATVKTHFDDTMKELLSAHVGNADIGVTPYKTPAILLRDIDSWSQFLHLDLKTVLLLLGHDGAPDNSTWSAGLVFDEQYYTELLPESQHPELWKPITTDGETYWGFQLPEASHGRPTSNPFRSVLVGGTIGSINMWLADRTAHRGLNPQGRMPGGVLGLVRPKQMSVVMYSASTVQPGYEIDLENVVVTQPVAVLEQFGLPVRMVCTACGEWIRFAGTYEELPPIWECQCCAETCQNLADTGLSELGTVMCGRCHEYRLAHKIRAPLHPHPQHLGNSVPFREYKLVPSDLAQLHAVFHVRDLHTAWLLLGTAFSKQAWDETDFEARWRFWYMTWEPAAAPVLATPQTLNAEGVLPERTAGFDSNSLYEELGVVCPGLKSVMISMLMTLQAKKLGRQYLKDVFKWRGYLFYRSNDSNDINVNPQLQAMLDNPASLNMDFAAKVAAKMTHNWNPEIQSLVKRCDCEFHEGGSRKLTEPGQWDERTVVCGYGYCRNAARRVP